MEGLCRRGGQSHGSEGSNVLVPMLGALEAGDERCAEDGLNLRNWDASTADCAIPRMSSGTPIFMNCLFVLLVRKQNRYEPKRGTLQPGYEPKRWYITAGILLPEADLRP